MTELENLALQATKDILEKNLQIYHKDLLWKKVVLIYDNESTLSRLISSWYIENLKNYPNSEIIEYASMTQEKLKEKILSLESYSTVIMVESTNFRLEEFRIRLSLQHRTIAWIEHNHLKYIKDNQIKTYLEAISYHSPYFQKVSDFLKEKNDKWNTMKIVSSYWSVLTLEWWFEDMKQNTWNFSLDSRYWTYPIWENFSEVKDFSCVNWEMYIKAYPGENLEMIFPKEPFKIEVKESLITCDREKTPESFLSIIDKIKLSENGEVMMRELWFWLNRAITREKTLTDVNQFERISGFHLSLWKKHNIYRKKFHKDIVQRYHIDIFPEVSQIYIDDELIFDSEKHFLVA